MSSGTVAAVGATPLLADRIFAPVGATLTDSPGSSPPEVAPMPQPDGAQCNLYSVDEADDEDDYSPPAHPRDSGIVVQGLPPSSAVAVAVAGSAAAAAAAATAIDQSKSADFVGNVSSKTKGWASISGMKDAGILGKVSPKIRRSLSSSSSQRSFMGRPSSRPSATPAQLAGFREGPSVQSPLESFVPRCLRHQIMQQAEQKGLELGFDGNGASITAAVLFSDASGFTALTERLSMLPNGAEQMCTVINKFFSILIDIVLDYGGDVVKFAGDALSILFTVGELEGEGQSASIEEAVARAMQCSLDIHARLHDYLAYSHEDPSRCVRLSLHMGLGCGQLTAVHLGGVFGRFEYVMAGAPMSQIAIAEPLANSGETVCSPEAFKELKRYLKTGCNLPVESEHKGYMLVTGLQGFEMQPMLLRSENEVDEDHEKLLKRYVPAAVTTKISGSGEETIDRLTELREVSVVFILTHGVDLTTENKSLIEATEQGQALMLEIQRHVFANEGSINKMLVDDKGLLTLAVFGLPPLPHENDPERAIRAARSLVNHISRVGRGVSCHVGVTTGTAFCGVIGSRKRREYTVMGDMVNLAARLMTAANSDRPVLCDEATHKSAMLNYQFEAMEPIKVKGKEKPIKLYFPIADKVEEEIQASLNSSGRHAEVAQCRGTIAELCTYRNGGTMAITGGYGSGRTEVIKSLEKTSKEANMKFIGNVSPEYKKGHFAPTLRRPRNSDGKLKLDAAALETAVMDGGIYLAWGPVLDSLVLMGIQDNCDYLVDNIGAEHLPNISDLNEVVAAGDPIEQREDYAPPPNRNAHENRIGKMITSIVLNFAQKHRTFVLLHLATLVGNQFKDRRSWEIASDLAQKVAKRDGALPEVVIAVTSMPIFQSALINLPLEVESIMELATQENAWLVMKPMSIRRRGLYLFTVLTNHGFELQPKDVPPQLVAYISDFASGAPRHIDLLVKALLDQHRITLQKTGLFNGCQASIRVTATELLGYRGCRKDSDDEDLGFADMKDLLKVCNIPKKIVGAARSKFDQLNDEKRTVLKRACVVHAFSLKMLSHLLVVQTDDPEQHSLDVLEQGDLLEMIHELIAEDYLVRNDRVGAAVRKYDEDANTSFSFQCRLLQVQVNVQILQAERDMLKKELESMANIEVTRLVRQRRLSKSAETKSKLMSMDKYATIGALPRGLSLGSPDDFRGASPPPSSSRGKTGLSAAWDAVGASPGLASRPGAKVLPQIRGGSAPNDSLDSLGDVRRNSSMGSLGEVESIGRGGPEQTIDPFESDMHVPYQNLQSEMQEMKRVNREMRRSFSLMSHLIHDEVETINSTLHETPDPERVKVIQKALKHSRGNTNSVKKKGGNRVAPTVKKTSLASIESAGSIESAESLSRDGATDQSHSREGKRALRPKGKAKSMMCVVM